MNRRHLFSSEIKDMILEEMLDRFLATGNAIEDITKPTDTGFPSLAHSILGLQPELTGHPSLTQTLVSFISNQNSRLFCAISELQRWYNSGATYPVLQLTAKNIDSIFKRSFKEARPYTAELTYAQRLIKIFQRKDLPQWAGIVGAYCKFYMTDKKNRGVPTPGGIEWEDADGFLPHGFDLRTLDNAASCMSGVGARRDQRSHSGDKESVGRGESVMPPSSVVLGLSRKRKRVVSVSEPRPARHAAKRSHLSRCFTEPVPQPVPSLFPDFLNGASMQHDVSLWQALGAAANLSTVAASSALGLSTLSAAQTRNCPTLFGAPEHLNNVETMLLGSPTPLGLGSLVPTTVQGSSSLMHMAASTCGYNFSTFSDIPRATALVTTESTMSDELLDQTFVEPLDDATTANVSAIVERLAKSMPRSVSTNEPVTVVKSEYSSLVDYNEGLASSSNSDSD